MRLATALLAIFMIGPTPASAQVKKWVDEEGTIHVEGEGPHKDRSSPARKVEPQVRSILSGEKQGSKLEERLGYLRTEVPEIEWVKIEGNSVYLGIRHAPIDLRLVVGMAAFNGNRAINFGVHVWVVHADYRGRMRDAPIHCGATARYGKVQKNDC